MMSLGACGSKLKVVSPGGLPPALIADCPETQTKLDMAEAALVSGSAIIPVENGDLVRKIRALRVDLRNCNADKQGLRSLDADMRKGLPHG